MGYDKRYNSILHDLFKYLFVVGRCAGGGGWYLKETKDINNFFWAKYKCPKLNKRSPLVINLNFKIKKLVARNNVINWLDLDANPIHPNEIN